MRDEITETSDEIKQSSLKKSMNVAQRSAPCDAGWGSKNEKVKFREPEPTRGDMTVFCFDH